MRNGNFLYIILLMVVAMSMMTQMNADPVEMRSRNFSEMMEILPLAMVMGIPLLLFGSMIYFVMKDNGKNACLITSSIFLAGFVSLATSLFMPIDQDAFIFSAVLLAFGTFVGARIFKDLKSKNYL
jgi:hypothetical protein